jgi:hypothetical protein
VKLNGTPKVSVLVALLVIAGADAAVVTVSVNDWLAGLPTPFDAVMVMG